MNNHRIMISFQDRVGIARDVAVVFAEHGINIVSLEVKQGEMYLLLDQVSARDLAGIIPQITEVSGVLKVSSVKWLPFELNQQRLRAIFDAVEESIFIVDRHGIITMCNKKADGVLGHGFALIDHHLTEAGFPPEIVRQIISGQMKQREVVLNTPQGGVRCLVKSNSTFNEHGELEGSMITFEKMSKVRRLAQFITHPVMVTFNDIIYSSSAMAKVINLAKTVARGTSTILVHGESGTGKELFARAIHMASPRVDNPYVVVNCAAIPDTLFESELFGYAEGTFTGGLKGGRQGLFEFAHTGTIFLDEVAEIPPHIQAKLLRVLQEGCVRRLGEMMENRVDVRIVAATNRDLTKMISEGSFREDLYYRLSVIPIYLPPLRKRRDDIPTLTWHFINKFNQRLQKTISSVSDATAARLQSYDWPGNVRELENAVERAVNLSHGTELDAESIPLACCVAKTDDHNELKRAVSEVEMGALIDALQKGHTVRKAAKILGVSHTTVLNKMKRYGISPNP